MAAERPSAGVTATEKEMATEMALERPETKTRE
jgi:hypothetical protein